MFKSGYIAILGVPNAGKSTLLNAILKQKIAAVTDKPQTTRKRLKGIYSTETCQMIFLDTPGIHESEKKLNRFMFQEIEGAVKDADVLCYLLPIDQKISPLLRKVFENNQKKYPEKVMLLIESKIDKRTLPKSFPSACRSRDDLTGAPGNGASASKAPFPLPATPREVPVAPANGLVKDFSNVLLCSVSALTGEGLNDFLQTLESLLPEGPVYYPEEDLTDENLRDLASEIIREKAMELMRQEIPYALAVEVVEFKEEPDLSRIEAHLIVDQESQKGMVIGKGGEMIREIGTRARKEIIALIGTKVFLELKVKVDKNWTKNPAKLARYGYQRNS